MARSAYLKLFIGISVFVFLYVLFVRWERKKSIEKYFDHPKVGDIYKIEADRGDGKWLSYYKITVIDPDKILFAPSKMMSDASVDYILKHFQNDNVVTYSISDLKAIKSGAWDNFQKDNTVLIEIIRKE